MLGVLIMCLAVIGCGHVVMLPFYKGIPCASLRIAVIGVMGLAGISFVVIGCGMCGCLYPRLLIYVSVLFAGYGCLTIANAGRRYGQTFFRALVHISPKVSYLAIAIIAGMIVIAIVASFAPLVGSFANDEILYHISVPLFWLKSHAMSTVPFAVGFLASSGEVLFAWGYALAGSSGAHCVSVLFYGVLIVATYAVGRILHSQVCGLLCAVVCCVNPVVFRSAWLAFTDVPVATCFMVAACLILLKPQDFWRRDFLAGLVVGFGCALKPTGYFYALALVMVMILDLMLQKKLVKEIGRSILFFGVGTIILGLFWPLWLWAHTGCPVFPPPHFLFTLFPNFTIHTGTEVFTKDTAEHMWHFYSQRVGDLGRGVHNFLILPITITFFGSVFQAGDSIGTVLASTLPFLCVLLVKDPRSRLLFIFGSVGAALMFFMVCAEARYILISIIVMQSLGVIALMKLTHYTSMRSALVVLICFNVCFGVLTAARLTAKPIKSVFSKHYNREYCLQNRPYAKLFAAVDSLHLDSVGVCYHNQVYLYLKTPYYVFAALPKQTTKQGYQPDTSYCIDIDYNVVVEDTAAALGSGFYNDSSKTSMTLVRSSTDARLYRSIR